MRALGGLSLGGRRSQSAGIYMAEQICMRCTHVRCMEHIIKSSSKDTPMPSAQLCLYMHVYAIPLRAPSSVVKCTSWSLIYAHCRGLSSAFWGEKHARSLVKRLGYDGAHTRMPSGRDQGRSARASGARVFTLLRHESIVHPDTRYLHAARLDENISFDVL
jgi:hypothetical protein